VRQHRLDELAPDTVTMRDRRPSAGRCPGHRRPRPTPPHRPSGRRGRRQQASAAAAHVAPRSSRAVVGCGRRRSARPPPRTRRAAGSTAAGPGQRRWWDRSARRPCIGWPGAAAVKTSGRPGSR
jgi:hypothetical protein